MSSSFTGSRKAIDRGAFERRAQEKEARLARQSPAIVSYLLTKIEEALGDSATPFEYLESLEVTSFSDYERAGAEAELQAFLNEWERDVAEYRVLYGTDVAST